MWVESEMKYEEERVGRIRVVKAVMEEMRERYRENKGRDRDKGDACAGGKGEEVWRLRVIKAGK